MKIAFVIQRYGLEVNGGAELLCRLIAEHLATYYSVDIITTCAIDYITWRNECNSGVEYLNGVKVIRFPVDYERDIESFNRKSEKVYGKYNPNEEIEWMKLQGPYSSSLLNYLKLHKDKYACIFLNTYLYSTTFFGMEICKDKTILISNAHNEPPIYLSIFKKVFSSPQYILFNTCEEREFVHSHFKNERIPSDIVGVGIDKPENLNAGNFIKTHGFQNFILFSGRICPSKNCHALFSDFIQFKEKNPSDLKLLLIGKPVMEIPAHPDIKYLGFVGTQEKFDAMAASKLLVMPSEFESLSIVLLETWYCKRPVLVNGGCEVLKGQCRRSNGGLWYENYDEFEACLSLLLRDEELCLRLGENGYRYVQDNYDWGVIERKYIDVIDSVMKNPNHSNNQSCLR